ncbi:MAG: HEAT repeat domain-containing protein [Oligoflexia bacterium]
MTRKKLILGLALVAGSVGVVAAFQFGLFGPSDPRERARIQREALLRQDRKNLTGKDSSESEVRDALMRLAAVQDSVALSAALDQVGHPSPAIRGAAAFALGRFVDAKALPALKGLLKDPVVEVRRDAIRALGSRAGEDRARELESLRQRKDLVPIERIALWESLLRWDRDGKHKSQALTELLTIARASGSNVEPALRAQALGLLATRFRGDGKVSALLKERAQSEGQMIERVTALQHLLMVRDPWVLENFRKLTVDSKVSELQSVGLQLLSRACPQGLWEILEIKMTQPSTPLEVRSAALSALVSLGGTQGYETFLRWKSEGRLSEPALASLASSIEGRLEQTRDRASRCKGF